jgi:acyl-CoA reductase-like NAD-dependent aldehyde dehydrogenase
LTALQTDFKSQYDALAEVRTVQSAVAQAIDQLSTWLSPEHVTRSLAFYTDSCAMHWEPRGVVLIISAWNYPLSLLIEPLVGALAAGCVAALKPSEVAHNTANVIAAKLSGYIECISVHTGGPETTQQLLDWPHWGLVFYTGNGRVGKLIQEKMAKNLVPTIMELGGKSPCVFLSGDVDVVAKRIVFGKLFNNGQTCVAPDYVLTPNVEGLLRAVEKAIHAFYGEDPCDSSELSSIVNDHHWDRLNSLLEGINESSILRIGTNKRETRRFAPTVVVNPPLNSRLMTEEIFGPILPIIEIATIEDAVKFVNSRDTPLAAYLFSAVNAEVDYFIARCPTGGMTINDTMMHTFSALLPLGGMGASGMGRYKGKWSLEAFSHAKPVMWRSLRGEMINDWSRNPPLTEKKFSLVSSAMFSPLQPRHLK